MHEAHKRQGQPLKTKRHRCEGFHCCLMSKVDRQSVVLDIEGARQGTRRPAQNANQTRNLKSFTILIHTDTESNTDISTLTPSLFPHPPHPHYALPKTAVPDVIPTPPIPIPILALRFADEHHAEYSACGRDIGHADELRVQEVEEDACCGC